MAHKRPVQAAGNDVLKSGSAGRLFSKTIGVSLAVMLSMSLTGAPVVKAEQPMKCGSSLKSRSQKQRAS
jgi:hypothetical protein